MLGERRLQNHYPDCVSEGEETDHLLRILSIQAAT